MNSVIDILKKLNLNYEDLNIAEKSELEKMEHRFSTKELTIVDIRDSIRNMIFAIEREIAGYSTPPSLIAWLFRRKRRLYLDARLQNLLMIYDFISTPEKAREMITQMLKNVVPK